MLNQAFAVFVLLAVQTDAFGVSKISFQSVKTSSFTQLAAEGTKITMPALSSTMKEGRVVTWLKSEGEPIEAGEAIMVRFNIKGGRLLDRGETRQG